MGVLRQPVSPGHFEADDQAAAAAYPQSERLRQIQAQARYRLSSQALQTADALPKAAVDVLT